MEYRERRAPLKPGMMITIKDTLNIYHGFTSGSIAQSPVVRLCDSGKVTID